MKTTKQVQKTGNRKLISALLILTLGMNTVSAMVGSQKTQQPAPQANSKSSGQYESKPQTILAFAVSSASGKQINTKTTNLQLIEQIEQEKSLEIESWMIDFSNFGQTKLSDERTEDKLLMIEPWMTNEKLWKF